MDALRFHFDVVSPYAYLAWTQIHALAERGGVTVEPVPVLFAALLGAHGTRGPAEVPARRAYLIHDVARLAHRFGVPLTPPPAHPFNPLLALRVASLPLPADQRRALIDGLFTAVWADGTGIGDPATVAAIAARAGLPADVLEQAEQPTAKARLRAQCDQAIAEGIFGVPTSTIRGQMFFGCDSLPHLEYFLAHGDVVPGELVARWANLPAAASRR
jgi:2-hydroxychromene-2-carboxylate isomerase